MRRLVPFAVAVLLAGVAVGVSGAASSAQSRWVIRDLGTWLGGKQSWAVAINERCQVVVRSETAQTVMVGDTPGPVVRAFLWQNGRLRDLGTRFGGPGSSAVAINDRGQVVGAADTKAIATSGHHVTHAFLWQNGSVRDLGTLGYVQRPGRESSYAVALNGRGQVVGASCRDERKLCRGFLWQNGKLIDLGTLGGAYTEPVAINKQGQIAGTGTTGRLGANRSPIRHAFLWQNGKLTDLGTLGGPRSGSFALNDRGQVIGRANTSAKSTSGYTIGTPIAHAFLWQNGTMRDLGSLGGEYSIALAINNRGQVVGTTSTKIGSHPFLWSGSHVRDLGTFGGPNSEPTAINERVQVIGGSDTTAKDKKGYAIRHAFLWQNGKLTDLGTLGGRSEAVAINEHNQMVGWSETKSGTVHAVLWTLKTGS